MRKTYTKNFTQHVIAPLAILFVFAAATFTNANPAKFLSLIKKETGKLFSLQKTFAEQNENLAPFDDVTIKIEKPQLAHTYVRGGNDPHEAVMITMAPKESALLRDIFAIVKGDVHQLDSAALYRDGTFVMHGNVSDGILAFENLYLPVTANETSTFTIKVIFAEKAAPGSRIALAISPRGIVFKKGFSLFRANFEEPIMSRYLTLIRN